MTNAPQAATPPTAQPAGHDDDMASTADTQAPVCIPSTDDTDIDTPLTSQPLSCSSTPQTPPSASDSLLLAPDSPLSSCDDGEFLEIAADIPATANKRVKRQFNFETRVVDRRASISLTEEPIKTAQTGQKRKLSEDTKDDSHMKSILEEKAKDTLLKTKGLRANKLFHPVQDLTQYDLPDCDPNWGIISIGDPVETNKDPKYIIFGAKEVRTPFPLWEDRKERFKVGQFQQVKGSDPPRYYNQEDNMVIKLMDMRPDRKTGLPARKPVVWTWGTPKNWDDPRTIKTLNDRRRDAIERISHQPPWTQKEREYIRDLLYKYPMISILELAMRFNHRFKGDYVDNISLDCDELHPGRTLEDIRAEYLTHKEDYDDLRVPTIRKTVDKRNKVRPALLKQQKLNEMFGLASNPRLGRRRNFNATKSSDSDHADGNKGKNKAPVMEHYAPYDDLNDEEVDEELFRLATEGGDMPPRAQ